METLLWGICYTALSDTMRETMSDKFDLELRGGGPPQGTALLRHVNEKTTMLDPKAQDRAAKKESLAVRTCVALTRELCLIPTHRGLKHT